MPGALDRLLHLPLRAVVRDEVLRLLARPERAHEDEASDAGVLRRGEQVARALRHDPLELLLLALADRDEVHDRVDALDRALQARRIGHVARDELALEVSRLEGSRTRQRTGRPAAWSACST